MVGCPQGHSGEQTKGGAAGNTQILQTECGVSAAYKESKPQKGVQGETLAQQIRCALNQLEAAKKGAEEHKEDLTEDHQPQPILRHPPQRMKDGSACA